MDNFNVDGYNADDHWRIEAEIKELRKQLKVDDKVYDTLVMYISLAAALKQRGAMADRPYISTEGRVLLNVVRTERGKLSPEEFFYLLDILETEGMAKREYPTFMKYFVLRAIGEYSGSLKTFQNGKAINAPSPSLEFKTLVADIMKQ